MLSNLDTYLEALRTSPLEFLLTLVYAVAVILISLILHECAHGYVAYRCGDPTAKMMGRLSLNPKAHLDLIGTLSMFLIGVGWAKPVPVNPRNFRHGRRDDFFVSIAGIATNLCLCLICMFLSVVVGKIMFGSEMLGEVSSSALPHLFSPFYQFADGRDNVILSITNGIFAESVLADFAVPWLRYVERFLLMMAQTNLGLALFNILPIPPLDGYHLVNDLLFKGKLQLKRQAFVIAQIVLILIFMTGALNQFLSKAIFAVYEFFLKGFLAIFGLS